MDNKDLFLLPEELAEKYVVLKNLERRIHSDKNFANELINGRVALTDARRIQREFFTMDDDSEKIVMTLLSQNFVYDDVDYSNELENKSAIDGCAAGLFLYVADVVADEISIINRKISDLQISEVF